MSRTLAPLALAVCLLAAAPARADSRPITFRDALTEAQKANPSIAQADLGVTSAEEGVLSANGLFDPNLDSNINWSRRKQTGYFQGFPFKSVSQAWDFGVGVSGMAPTGTQYQLETSLDYNYSSYTTQFNPNVSPSESIEDAYTSNTSVSITQPLLRGVTLAWNLHNITLARSGLSVARLSLEKTRQDTLAQVAQSYWTWAYDVQAVQIAQRQVATAQEALRVGKLQLQSGQIAPVEKTRLEAALVQAQQNELTAEVTAQQAGDALLLLMGEAPGQDVVPATPLGEVPPLQLDVDKAVEVAVAQNLDLAVQKAQVDKARAELTYAKEGRLPTLSGVASAGLGAQANSLGGAYSGLFGSDAFPYYSVGGQFSVPLGNRAARGQADQSEVSLHQAQLQLQDLERSVRSQVEHQVRLLQQAGRRVELADVNLRLAKETLAAEEALAKAGRAIEKDVLEARASAFQAEVDAAKARADYRLAQTELLRLQGQIDLALP